MDETELREVLVARAARGASRGADEMVRAVALTLAPPRPPRRRQRLLFALAMVIAVVTSVLVLAAHGTDRVVPARPLAPASNTPTAPLTTPARGGITSVHAIDGAHAWVVTDGAVFVTADHGVHWHSIVSPGAALAGVRRAAFASATSGVTLEETGRTLFAVFIQANQDGPTAATMLGPVHGDASAVEITHAPDGYVVTVRDDCRNVTCHTRLFASADGVHWTDPYNGTIALTGVRCALHGNCWAFTPSAASPAVAPKLWRTVDGGRTWKQLDVPIPATAGTPVAARVVAVQDKVFAYEVDDRRDASTTVTPILVVSRDSGRTWSTHVWPAGMPPTASDGLRLRVFRSAGARWTVLLRSAVLRSDDDTLQWRSLGDRLPFAVTISSWADASTAWVVGAGSHELAYTTDAGSTWKRAAPLPR